MVLLDQQQCELQSRVSVPAWLSRINFENPLDCLDKLSPTFDFLEMDEFERLKNGFTPDPSCIDCIPIAYKESASLFGNSVFSVSKLPENKHKNRYGNVLPFDYNRVRLATPRELEYLEIQSFKFSDYINASHVGGFFHTDQYVAAQGPLDSTIPDFYNMILDHEIRVVVMLTPLIESQRVKCAQYWPEEGNCLVFTNSHLPIKIEHIRESRDQRFDSAIVRQLRISRHGKQVEISQIHFENWADRAASNINSVLSLISLAESIQSKYKSEDTLKSVGPMLVHCSAGCGRTGTFITIAICMALMREERQRSIMCADEVNQVDEVDLVFQTVGLLREQRVKMVQTFDQFKFCYEALKVWAIHGLVM
ncbi:hypothetical protein HK096_011233 [Nowakowskiella sp. JEL0078]|nr:hypothetical protein HK096_011233 [Nowakowskiella sp. JEL0078]